MSAPLSKRMRKAETQRAEVARLEQSLHLMKLENEDLRQQVIARDWEFSEFRTQITELTRQLEKAQSDNDALRRALEGQQSQTEQATRKTLEMLGEFKQLGLAQHDLQAKHEKERDVLLRRLKNSDGQIRILRATVSELQSKLRATTAPPPEPQQKTAYWTEPFACSFGLNALLPRTSTAVTAGADPSSAPCKATYSWEFTV
eukprot:m51a1_g6606 hypothetical protein (202) ;mRNA; f:11318-12041